MSYGVNRTTWAAKIVAFIACCLSASAASTLTMTIVALVNGPLYYGYELLPAALIIFLVQLPFIAATGMAIGCPVYFVLREATMLSKHTLIIVALLMGAIVDPLVAWLILGQDIALIFLAGCGAAGGLAAGLIWWRMIATQELRIEHA